MEARTDIEELNVPQLAERCRQEAARSRRNLPYDPRYCFELFRRALGKGDQAAWEAINAQYRNLIRHWTGNPHNAEDLIQETLARFSQKITPEQLRNYPTLGHLLSYMKITAKNLVIDRQRRDERERRALDAWLAEVERRMPPDLDAHLDRESLMAYIRSRLNDPEEDLVFTLTFDFDLAPLEIAVRHPERFPTAEDVYRVKERFLRRLRRDPRLRRLTEMI